MRIKTFISVFTYQANATRMKLISQVHKFYQYISLLVKLAQTGNCFANFEKVSGPLFQGLIFGIASMPQSLWHKNIHRYHQFSQLIKSCNTGHIFVLKAKLSLAVLTKYRTSVMDETMGKKNRQRQSCYCHNNKRMTDSQITRLLVRCIFFKSE